MDNPKHHWRTSIFNVYSRVEIGDHYVKKGKTTKFKNWVERWFHPLSWKNKYFDYDVGRHGRVHWKIVGLEINKPVQITDSWHFFKMLMIIFMAISVITFDWDRVILIYSYWWDFILLLVSYGAGWNLPFSFFYKWVLVKKKS